MNAGGETADQMVRMSLQGIEIAANVALKVGGEATKSLAATLYAILTDKKKVKGKARLDSLLRSGKELKVFAIRNQDLKLFCEEAKRYGVLYSVLKEKNNKDGICDIMVRAEDASKISRIVDKFELATVDPKAMKQSIISQQMQKEKSFKDTPTMNDQQLNDLVSSLMDSTKEVSKTEQVKENPKSARTRTKNDNLFEPTSKNQRSVVDTTDRKPSVRKELQEIKIQRVKRNQAKSKTRGINHQSVSRKKRKKVR